MDRERFKALCALYFLNTIQPDELKELKSALNSGDRELQEIFYRTKKSIDKLPLTVDIIDHGLNVNQDIFNVEKNRKQKRMPFLFKKYHPEMTSIRYHIVAAVSILLFLSLLILTFYLYQISSVNSKLNNLLIDRSAQLENDNKLFNVLKEKNIDVINLTGQDVNPSGYGKIFWSAFSKEAVLQVGNLPPINEMKDYQLWLVKNDSNFSEGVVKVKAYNSNNFYYIKDLPLNNDDTGYSFILTLEPKGGSSKPTGTIYLKGKVTK